jgi:hypothetical protein
VNAGQPRGRSSVGRAPALQAGGRGFESHRLHFTKSLLDPVVGRTSVVRVGARIALHRACIARHFARSVSGWVTTRGVGCHFLETVGEDAVPTVRSVLVDEGGPRTGVTESGHELLGGGTELSRQSGACVPEVVQVHGVGQIGLFAGPGPCPCPVGPCRRSTPVTDKQKSVGSSGHIALEVRLQSISPGALGHQPDKR